jgi:hypothetical protein
MLYLATPVILRVGLFVTHLVILHFLRIPTTSVQRRSGLNALWQLQYLQIAQSISKAHFSPEPALRRRLYLRYIIGRCKLCALVTIHKFRVR